MANTFRQAQSGIALGFGQDAGTATKALVLDSAFVLGTSGDAIGYRFCSPVSQTNGALLLYAMPDDKAGTPKYTCTLHDSAAAGGTATIPKAGAALATSDERTGPADDEWDVFTFAGVTLVAGSYYWLILQNTAADPTTDKGAFYTRGALDGHYHAGGQIYAYSPIRCYTSTDGFQTSAHSADGAAPVVLKFADGSVTGHPYIGSAAHASNANYRGNRLTIPGAIVVNGLWTTNGVAAMNACTVYDGAGTSVATKAIDEVGEDHGAFLPATTLTAGTAYDYVVGFGSASTALTLYNMVEAEANVPADVKAAGIATYVDGATPGSFTADTSTICGQLVITYQDIPAASGGRPELRGSTL